MAAHDNAFTATWMGIRNTFVRGPAFGELGEDMRLDGGHALVTGASSGLGFALASELARRGASVVGAARSAGSAVRDELRRAAGRESIDMIGVDLADLDSIDRLVEQLAARGHGFDRVILNAAIVPTKDQRTAQALEQMFVVNYLANVLLIERLLERELLPAGARIVVIASEAHRGAKAMDLARLGEYEAFGMSEVLERYGTYKLALLTHTFELARRLEPRGIFVHATCPGAVDTKLAREAPRWSKPILRVVFGLFFRAPAEAAAPSLHLCLAPHLCDQTGIYLHQWVRKDPDPRVLDERRAREQWDASQALLARLGRSRAS